MKRVLTVLLMCAIILNATSVFAAKDKTDSKGKEYDYVLTETKEYETDDSEYFDFSFEKTIEEDGLSFYLENVEYSVESMYDSEIGKDISYEVSVEEQVSYEEKETYSPQKSYSSNGYEYAIKDVSYEETTAEVYPLERNVQTELLTAEPDIDNYPATMPYEYEGKEYSLPYKDYEAVSSGWHDGYYLYGTIYNYDAATYQIGDVVIANNEQNIELDPRNYAGFLEGLEVPADKYKVNAVYYAGEPYTNAKGVICRDYIIDCQMYGTIYSINYLYELNKPDYTARITYMLTDDDKEYLDKLKSTYRVTATAYYSEVKVDGLSIKIKLAIGAGAVIVLLLIAALVVYYIRGGRRRTEDMNMREARDDYKHLK